jgi:hypothetical protein
MRQILRGVPLFVLPVALAVSGPACVDITAGEARFIDTVEKRFTVSGAPTLDISTFDGSVDVSTWDRPEVLVVIEKHAIDKAAADRMVVTADQTGDVVKVSVREGGDDRSSGLHINFGSHSARLTVTLPAKAQIEARTGDGRVTVRNVEGDLRVRTGDGAIHLEQVNGSVDATSGDGSIDIDGAVRGLSARSGDGRVRIRAASTPTADWNLVTGDGSVLLEVPEGFGAELDATTGDGRVDVRDVPFSGESDRRDRRDRRTARGRLGNGGPNISIRSGDGVITIRRSDSAS